MALALDASTPAQASNNFANVRPASLTSASFTPPGGAVLVLTMSAQESFLGGFTALTVTDSLAAHLTWTVARSQGNTTSANDSAGVWVAWAYAGASSPGAMTVTATANLNDTAQFIYDLQMHVRVWTGANTAAPIGTVSAGSSASSPASTVLTPSGTNSVLMMAATEQIPANGIVTPVVGTGCKIVDNFTGAKTQHVLEWWGTGTTPTLTSSAQTMAFTTADATPAFEWIAFEIVAGAAAVSYVGHPTMLQQAARRAAFY